MKVTYNWLKNFVDIKIAPQALADKLTMAGLEVKALESVGGDYVFEVEITSNRPDCLSVVGVARELAAVTGKRLRLPGSTRRPLGPSAKDKLLIEIENKKDCPLYTGKIVRNVQVGPSPDWLKSRLESVGLRSINNVVDITNYVLMEWGQPLHAFDLDKLTDSSIVVRRARQGEEIQTIDGLRRRLDPDILIIADSDKPVAIAGIMGGKDAEVIGSTQNILLEAAAFNPILVRRGRQKLGIQTDSSYRFERGVDSRVIDDISWYAVELIHKNCGETATCVQAKSSGAGPKAKHTSISLSMERLRSVLGADISRAKARNILEGLQFSLKQEAGDKLLVKIPHFRRDIAQEMDLVEEVARIFGYDRLPSTLPAAIPQITSYTPRDFISLIKSTLTSLGLHEAVTYSLVEPQILQSACLQPSDKVAAEIANPLSKQQAVLRTTLLPSLLRATAVNLNQKQDYVNLFEIAKCYYYAGEGPGTLKEEFFLGISLCGSRSFFLTQGVSKDAVTPLHIKGVLEALFGRLGIKDYDFLTKDSQAQILVNGEDIGLILEPAQQALEKFEIKIQEVALAQIALERLMTHINLARRFIAPPVFPGISRDISCLFKEQISAKDILASIRSAGSALLQEVAIVDYYRGRQIPEGFKGLTIACTYRSAERTLTEEEVNPLHAAVISLLVEKFAAKLR